MLSQLLQWNPLGILTFMYQREKKLRWVLSALTLSKCFSSRYQDGKNTTESNFSDYSVSCVVFLPQVFLLKMRIRLLHERKLSYLLSEFQDPWWFYFLTIGCFPNRRDRFIWIIFQTLFPIINKFIFYFAYYTVMYSSTGSEKCTELCLYHNHAPLQFHCTRKFSHALP